MNLRPKTKRRLAIVFLGLFLVVASLGGLYLFRKHQINQRTLQARAEGLAAFKQGDYVRSLEALSFYNARNQQDPETLFAFGKARARVETPNNHHLGEAIQYFRRGLELQPDNTDAKHQLLALYTNPSVQYNAEATALADALLAKDGSDIVALRAKAKALYNLHKFSEAFDASQKLNELAPLDVEGQRITYELMYHLKKPNEEILARAQKAREAHADDPRFQLLQGLAFMIAGDSENANKWLRTASKATPPDAEFVKQLTNLFDTQRLYDESDSFLERAAAANNSDPQMARMLIQRLWQNGRFADAAKRLEKLDPNSPNSDSHLLAYRAFCLYQLSRADEARPIVSALVSRKDDDIALAWAKALRTRFDSPDMPAREQINQYQGALVRDPSNPVIRNMIGDAYARLGETEPALQAWRQAADEVPSWSMPRTRIARLLASTGRGQDAVEEAIAAYNRSQNVGTAIGLAVAWSARIAQADDPNLRPKVLELAKEIQTKLPGEPETLPIYVELLARQGSKDEANKAITDALSAKQLPSEETLLRLSDISRRFRLGQEEAILTKARQLKGNTPAIALAHALQTAAAGKAQEGLAALKASAASAPSATRLQWELSIAEFLQRTNDASAKDAWIALGDKNPNDVTVQNAIVNLPDNASVWKDRPFISRTIDRLRALTGDEGTRWQLARARYLLSSDQVDRDSAQAVVLLTDLVRTSPNLIAPRIYLAKAFQNVHNSAAAIEQLKAAAQTDPDSAAIAIELARLLQDEGKYEEAKRFLSRAAQNQSLEEATRVTIAAALAQQGDGSGAVALLEAAPPSPDPERDVLLINLYRRTGEFKKAEPLVAKILARQTPSVQGIAVAADFQAARGDLENARKTLARIADPTLKVPAEQQELFLAEFEGQYGEKKVALEHFNKALAAANRNPSAWRSLINFHIHSGDVAAATAASAQALAAIPSDPDIQSLNKQLAALQASGGRADLGALMNELSRDPRNTAAVEALAIINEARKTSEPVDKTAEKLRPLANRYPRFIALQKLLIQMYLKLGKFEDAEQLADRTSHLFPTSPDAAQMAASVYAASGEWTKMLTASDQWRARSLDNPRDADIAIAQARSQLNQASAAAKQLEPYIADAQKDPDRNVLLLSTYARALILDERDQEAAAILQPLLANSVSWRSTWLKLATQIRGGDHAAAWIDKVATIIPTTDNTERYNLADAWYGLGVRWGIKRGFTEAQAILVPLAKANNVAAQVPLLLGATNEKLDDHAGAIAAYRQALQINPNISIAQNNLAYQLLIQNESLPEAQSLAEKAVAANPRDGGFADTLARVYFKRGDKTKALEMFKRAAELSPNDIQTLIGFAQTLVAEQKSEPAHEVLEKIESLARADPATAAPFRQDMEALRQALK